MKIYNEIETIKKLQKGYSISRFGDGEFRLIKGKNMVYQNYNKDISIKLKNILSQRNIPKKLLVGIPPVYDTTKENLTRITNNKVIVYWNKYMMNNESLYIETLLDKNAEYYSSFISRIESFSYNKNDYLCELKKIWNNRNTVLIINKEKYILIKYLIHLSLDNAQSINIIFCENKNAYNQFNDLYQKCIKNDISTLFLLMIGPTASILACELCNNNYQAIDIGSFFELYENTKI